MLSDPFSISISRRRIVNNFINFSDFKKSQLFVKKKPNFLEIRIREFFAKSEKLTKLFTIHLRKILIENGPELFINELTIKNYLQVHFQSGFQEEEL